MAAFFRQTITGAVLALGLVSTVSTAANAQTAYAIANGGNSLISFDVANPGAATLVGNFFGAGTALDAIDFRPLNGVLYGYNDIADSLYAVNTSNGALTLVANSTGTPGATNSQIGGLDFNPAIDRVRYVNLAGENRVYNPNSAAPATGLPTVMNLRYAADDPNFDPDFGPSVVENAYANNIAGRTGTQYVIDSQANTLATLNNNGGVLTTVGGLGIDVSTFAGFDIFTTLGGVNTAYGIFDTSLAGEGVGSSLYTLDLGTGVSSAPIGSFSTTFGSVYSLAVTPTVVPEAGALPLLMGGMMTAGLGIVARRRLRK